MEAVHCRAKCKAAGLNQKVPVPPPHTQPTNSTESLGPCLPSPHFQSKVRLWLLNTPLHNAGGRGWLYMCVSVLCLNICEQNHSSPLWEFLF